MSVFSYALAQKNTNSLPTVSGLICIQAIIQVDFYGPRKVAQNSSFAQSRNIAILSRYRCNRTFMGRAESQHIFFGSRKLAQSFFGRTKTQHTILSRNDWNILLLGRDGRNISLRLRSGFNLFLALRAVSDEGVGGNFLILFSISTSIRLSINYTDFAS